MGMDKKQFYEKWLHTFAAGISESKLRKYVLSYGNFIWHIFSWQLLDEKRYLTGKAAEEAYNSVDKHGALYIEWFKKDHTDALTDDLSSSAALGDLYEVYVVAEDFSWTYIKTHENEMCGPYFMKI